MDATYDATVDPLRYETLLQCWEAFLRYRMAHKSDVAGDLLCRLEQGEDPAAAAVIAHFSRAMEIFERLGRARRVEAEIQSIVDTLPAIGLVVDTQGRAVALNAGARALAPDHLVRPRLTDLAVERSAIERVLDWIRGRASGASSEFLMVPFRLETPTMQSCLIAAPIGVGRSVGGAVSTHAAEGPFFLITSLDLNLDSDIVRAFAHTFELSCAEGAVAAALARGAKPVDIAGSRGASVNTVRSQIKSATKKIGADGVTDIVRMFSGFAASFSAARAASKRSQRRLEPHDARRHGAATLSSGRRVSYIEQGAPNGRPALFLHSLCFGPYWPDRAIEAAARKRWRLICPWRPGFGDTDPNPQHDLEGTISAAVSDMLRLLDRLEIDRALIISHQTASIFAIRLARAAPQRVQGILSLTHLPIWRDDWIPHLPSRLRLLARTTRYAPRLLPFLVRAAMAMVDAGEEARLGRAFFHDAEHELRAFQRPEISAPMAEGVEGSARQGPFAICQEARIALQDYAAELRELRTPMRVIHGAQDLTMPSRFFVGVEELAPNLEVTEIAGAGATLLYTHWQVVLDYLERLSSETSPEQRRAG